MRQLIQVLAIASLTLSAGWAQGTVQSTPATRHDASPDLRSLPKPDKAEKAPEQAPRARPVPLPKKNAGAKRSHRNKKPQARPQDK
jgi:hypothetical protein